MKLKKKKKIGNVLSVRLDKEDKTGKKKRANSAAGAKEKTVTPAKREAEPGQIETGPYTDNQPSINSGIGDESLVNPNEP